VINAMLSCGVFFTSNSWFFGSNAFPFEVSVEELLNERSGLVAFAAVTLAAIVSMSCLNPGMDVCENRRLVGILIAIPGLILIFWGMCSSALAYVQHRNSRLEDIDKKAATTTTLRNTPEYSWRLNSMPWQGEHDRAEGKPDVTTSSSDAQPATEEDKAAFANYKNVAARSDVIKLHVNPHVNVKTAFKMFINNAVTYMGVATVLFGMAIAATACDGVTGLSSSKSAEEALALTKQKGSTITVNPTVSSAPPTKPLIPI